MTDIAPKLGEIDRVAFENTKKVLGAFQKHRVSDGCFAVRRVTATATGAAIRLTRSTPTRSARRTPGANRLCQRTHALTAACSRRSKRGDILLSATGAPYDTLRGVIGLEGDYRGSMKDYGIGYAQAELLTNGKPDFESIFKLASDPRVAAVFVQRSRGYSNRPALSVAEIGDVVETVRRASPRAAVIVDNCYGEFVESREPTDAGADLMAGSLIKNPGGGIAPTGGYIAGRRALVEAAAHRLTSPGIGGECGASLGQSRLLYQGFFLAPHTVAQALKTAVFCARLLELMGYETNPRWDAPRSDIIQAVAFGEPDLLRSFCEGIQAGAPVDSFVRPEPWDMPGYGCQVIMAAGAFIQGASIELSADGPMREPFTAYLQGGLTFESGRLGILTAAERLWRN
jgi:cystathionine beta-lyase family protein involved in aluminum resistance